MPLSSTAAAGALPGVAIISSNFWPEPTGISQTTGEFASFLAARGYRVAVATAMPYYPEWQIRQGYRRRLWMREDIEGVQVYRAWHLVSPRPSTLTRLAHEITLCAFLIPQIVRAVKRASVVYVVSPDLSVAVLGLWVARVLGRPRVLVVKDVMPDAAVDLGMMRNPALIGASRWLARRAYASASVIHTLGDGMRRRIEALNPARPIEIVPDTIDAGELAPPAPAGNLFRARFVPPGTFAVVHSGNMGKKQDLDLLLRAADLVRDDSAIHFYVFGDGAVRERFLRRRDELRLANVSHHPLQERSLLPHMLAGADVLLVSQLAEVGDLVVPSKLITAMAAGAMVVAACSADSETARLVTESGGGIRIESGDASALVETIGRLRREEVDAEPFRIKARAYATEHFDRNVVYGRVAEELNVLATHR
ncbi:MAG TPA: glycosyltransferase [Gemmatimonadales bacterium]|nr:glycosyltransferase [Gemmatimonadales bacterium]